MTVLLAGVIVPADLVGSSGFRARTGAEVSLALEVYCRHRVPALDQDRRQAVVRHSPAAGPTGELVFTGVVVPFARACRLGGWVLNVAGMPLYVTEASTSAQQNDRDPDSDPEEPLPEAGTWVRVRGTVGVADGYVVDEIEQALQQGVERLWQVRRITRFRSARGRGERVEAIRYTGDASGYLVDLVAAGTGAAAGDA